MNEYGYINKMHDADQYNRLLNYILGIIFAKNYTREKSVWVRARKEGFKKEAIRFL